MCGGAVTRCLVIAMAEKVGSPRNCDAKSATEGALSVGTRVTALTSLVKDVRDRLHPHRLYFTNTFYIF